jgi:hypothetical protein
LKSITIKVSNTKLLIFFHSISSIPFEWKSRDNR